MRVLIRLTAPFYTVVDQLVDELQEHVWAKSGKPKRRLKGDGLEKLHYSVECLVRGCVAVVLQRKRKSEAAIRKGRPSVLLLFCKRPDHPVAITSPGCCKQG
jgi:hypothetical protein